MKAMIWMLFAMIPVAAQAQEAAPPPAAETPAQVAPAPAPAQQVLKEGTEVHLLTRNAISSKTAKAGDPVELVVAEPVVVNGATVIPAGAVATGEVEKARDNGLLGRSGKLDLAINEIKAGGRTIPVRGAKDAKGKGGTIGAVGAGVVFLPLALVVKGKEAKIPEGTKLQVYVDKDIPFIAGQPLAAAEQPIVAQTNPAPQ